jgi:hypothetical protein
MKWLAYILSFYILFSAVVPCSLLDNCEEEYENQTSASYPAKECKECSPFSICSIRHGFAIHVESLLTEPLVVFTSVLYREIIYSAISAYYFTHFQPPRMV